MMQIRNDYGAVTSPYIYHTYGKDVVVEGVYGLGYGNDQATLVPSSELASYSSHYTMYEVTVPHVRTATFTVGAIVGGRKYTQTKDVVVIPLLSCDSD